MKNWVKTLLQKLPLLNFIKSGSPRVFILLARLIRLTSPQKISDSEKLISILQERYAFEDERNEANREAEEKRDIKRQKIAVEKDER